MNEVKLIRFTDKKEEFFTCGNLIIDNFPFCVTLERPWLTNANYISCIPEGEYECIRDKNIVLKSGKVIPVTYRVLVPDRSGILFHSGVTVADTEGCILLGMGFQRYPVGVGLSQGFVAKDRFIREMNGVDRFVLSIERYVKGC